MSSRILVVYFSRSGHTHSLAEQIASRLDADLEPIREPIVRSGTLGYLRSGLQALFKRRVEIAAPEHDPASYELVVIGTPIWNMAVSSPVRSYLGQTRESLRQVGFFATLGGMGAERSFEQMARLVGRQPIATLGVRQDALATSSAEVQRFVDQLRQALPAPVRPPPEGPRPDLGPSVS